MQNTSHAVMAHLWLLPSEIEQPLKPLANCLITMKANRARKTGVFRAHPAGKLASGRPPSRRGWPEKSVSQ